MGELRVGERVRLLDGSFATVTRVQAEHAPCADPAWLPGMAGAGTLGTAADPQTGTFTTYNFEVATWHTYFAAPAGSSTTHAAIWVHNQNVGVCREGKDFLRGLKDRGVSPEVRRHALDAKIRQSAPPEVVQRWMSESELKATVDTGRLRGGREGPHFVSPSANRDPLRARQRLALPQTPEVRVTMEVPGGVFSNPSRVRPQFSMPGGGLEQHASGSIPVKILNVSRFGS